MGRLNIPTSSIVYLDTSIFIYTVESHPDYWLVLQPLWLMFQHKEIERETDQSININDIPMLNLGTTGDLFLIIY